MQHSWKAILECTIMYGLLMAFVIATYSNSDNNLVPAFDRFSSLLISRSECRNGMYSPRRFQRHHFQVQQPITAHRSNREYRGCCEITWSRSRHGPTIPRYNTAPGPTRMKRVSTLSMPPQHAFGSSMLVAPGCDLCTVPLPALGLIGVCKSGLALPC